MRGRGTGEEGSGPGDGTGAQRPGDDGRARPTSQLSQRAGGVPDMTGPPPRLKASASERGACLPSAVDHAVMRSPVPACSCWFLQQPTVGSVPSGATGAEGARWRGC